MASSALNFMTILVSVASAFCYRDDCADHVTGTSPGIGFPQASRISLCNRLLHTTIRPESETVTSTVTIRTTSPPPVFSRLNAPNNATSTARQQNGTIVPMTVPAYATPHCTDARQFSSACRCWPDVTRRNTTLSVPTSTVTTTKYVDAGCGPATTAVSPDALFPCSGRWGWCACLRADDDDVCVRVRSFFGEGEHHETGPCGEADECDADGDCRGHGRVCVYDGSCDCGKRRCYSAAPDGCNNQGLPPGYGGRKV